MSNRPHDEEQEESQADHTDYAALLEEVRALRELTAAQTELLQAQAAQAAQQRAPQPRYAFMQNDDVAWTTPTQLPRDDDAERAAAIAERDALLARAEETAPPARAARFLAGNEVAMPTVDPHGNDMSPAAVRRRAEEQGAESLRRRDELRALRQS